MIKANTVGTMNLLELAYQKNVKGFLYFSSGEVNGDIFETVTSVKESDYGKVDPLNVRSCYAESKRMGENICSCYFYQYKVPVKIVRLSHTYGPTIPLDDERVFVSFVKNVLNNQNIELNSDGSAKRCFLYLSDAVRAYFKVLLDGENANVYNVSNDYDILESVINGVGVSVGFTIAIVIMAGLREKTEFNDFPESFKGMPMVLITAGLMAIAFCGFAGLM